VLGRFAGIRPKGWLGPGLTQTYETPELLAAAGIQYIGDWVYDDEPTEIRTASNTSKPSTTISLAMPGYCTGTGSRSSTGINGRGPADD